MISHRAKALHELMAKVKPGRTVIFRGDYECPEGPVREFTVMERGFFRTPNGSVHKLAGWRSLVKEVV